MECLKSMFAGVEPGTLTAFVGYLILMVIIGAIFCKKTETFESDARRWLPLVAAAQLVKGKEENRAPLMKHVNSVE